MRRRVNTVCICVCALAIAGCGGAAADDPLEVLAATTERLGDIESADLDVDFEVTPSGIAGDDPFGWRIEGPVEFSDDGLPEAEVTFTQFVGGEEGSARFLSDGEQAVAELGGTAYALPEEETAGLRGRGEDLGVLDISEWVRDPRVEDGPEIDGTETQVVRADLDAGAAFGDLLELLPEGAGVSSADLDPLANAVRAASIEVVSGREDHLLRRLRIELTFASDTSEELGGQPIAGASFLLEVALTDLNKDVEVEIPAETEPLPEM